MRMSTQTSPGIHHELLDEKDYYARTVVVPVGRPDTASEMLRLAGEMVHPSEGLVIALVISLGDAERANRVSSEISQLVEEFRQNDRGHQVELALETTTTVSRGILDVARERNADVIILGVQRSTQGKVRLGTVVENVIATAPCGVLIYRSAAAPDFERVVIPVDGETPSTVATRLGISIALQHDLPLLQLRVQHDYHYNPANEALIHAMEDQLPKRTPFSKRIIAGRKPELEIVPALEKTDLLVIGFSQKSDFERLVVDDLSNQLLNAAPCPVILISRIEWHRGVRGLVEHGMARLNPHLTLVEQNEMIWSAQKSAKGNLDYTVMIVLSAALATLGLLTNSAAVIIGAMLIAPLMSPLSSFSTGMATGILRLARRASLTMIQGVALALMISVVMGLVLPIDTPTDEILARGSPNLLDAAIALVSGWVAAYATARKDIPAALAGVAIAAALMPPLCTIGLGIALQDLNLAVGAALLFLANITFIIAAQYITFLWLGMHPREDRNGASVNRPRVWWLVLLIITACAMFAFARLGTQAIDEAHIRERLENEAFSGATVVDYHVSATSPLAVQMVVQSEHEITPEEVEAAHLLVNDLYDSDVDVKVIARYVVRPIPPIVAAVSQRLAAIFPDGDIVKVTVDEANGLHFRATLQAVNAPAREQMLRAQVALVELAGAGANLEILYQPVIALNAMEGAPIDGEA